MSLAPSQCWTRSSVIVTTDATSTNISTIPYKKDAPKPDSKLVRAAVKYDDVVYVGFRHGNCFFEMRDAGVDRLKSVKSPQGFVDQYGSFFSRYQAARIAIKSKQIKKVDGPELMSEQLWDNEGKPRGQ